MAIEIPENFRGKPIKGAIDRVLAKQEVKTQPTTPINQPTSLDISANIDPEQYLQVPDTNYVIALEQSHHNMDYKDTHKAVLKQGLYVPTPDVFMKHFVNVVNAKNKGNPIFDARNHRISRDKIDELYRKLTSNCWVWLNAKFVGNTLEEVIGIDSTDNLQVKDCSIEPCLQENGYVDLEFNKQGLATKKSGKQNYSQGQNIYFYYPRDKSVAGFDADSGRAYLYCNWIPDDRYDTLGVFACCEATQKKSGAKSK